MKKIKPLIDSLKSKYIPHCLLLLYWPLHGLVYMLLNKYTYSMNYHLIQSSIDDYIPFSEWFVLPYVTWFFYIGTTLVYFLIKNKKDFLKANCLVVGGMVISMIICFVYPSAHELRPTEFAGSNFALELVRYLYSVDNPAVIFPSMHVLISCMLYISIVKSESLGKNRLVRALSFLLSLAITLSTVFIKQHSILDMFFAFILIVPIYLLTYRVIFKREKND